MSFGFGVGDFAGVLQLSWTLYSYCYKVARDASKDIKILPPSKKGEWWPAGGEIPIEMFCGRLEV